jgi:hypothetical protein
MLIIVTRASFIWQADEFILSDCLIFCARASSMKLDIATLVVWDEGLPRPQWDVLEAWIDSHCPADARRNAWDDALQQWLEQLQAALGGELALAESEHFFALALPALAQTATKFAEHARTSLLAMFSGVADFATPGKQVIVSLPTLDEYYRYISYFYPEGEHGGSLGVHLRESYPHVALFGKDLWVLENTLAHELMHVSLHRCQLPQWVEEGLAQMFEHDMTGRNQLLLDREKVAKHKDYWTEHGLDAFWYGQGFHLPDDVQELSYQLAEIVVRLMVEEARPRWFGLVRGEQQRFFEFLRTARADDCGAAASEEHLRLPLAALASRFLGEGDWSPTPYS